MSPSLARSGFNGACLCRECHVLLHSTYGTTETGVADFAEFVGLGPHETRAIDLLIYALGRQDIEKAIHELQLLLALHYPEEPA